MTEMLTLEPIGAAVTLQEQTRRPIPSAVGMLIRHNEAIAFEVVDMEADIVERDGVIVVSSKLPRNGPEHPGESDVPTQMQRIHMYLEAKERQAIEAGHISEPPPTVNSLSFRQVKFAHLWLARRLTLFDGNTTPQRPPRRVLASLSER